MYLVPLLIDNSLENKYYNMVTLPAISTGRLISIVLPTKKPKPNRYLSTS